MARRLTLDASIVVKWFKKGEEFEDEALKLRGEILSSTTSALACELMPLEVCRALVRVGYTSQKVEEAYAALSEMSNLDFLKMVAVTALKDRAKELIIALNLYVADAASLATALDNAADLLTEDKHLLKQELEEFMEKEGLKIIRLNELYR
ncbi:MAG: type II toxin-antitoxin system VapC family toxin [Candidatus Geothermarchaeales archaeon]